MTLIFNRFAALNSHEEKFLSKPPVDVILAVSAIIFLGVYFTKKLDEDPPPFNGSVNFFIAT